MRLFVALLRVLLVVAAATGGTQGQERIGAFWLPDNDVRIVVLDGEIGINTPLEFRRVLLARPAVQIVALNSPGGLVASALILAGDIHDRGLSTAIPSTFSCHSACAYVFFSGAERLAEGELGVHQMAGSNDVAGVQATVSDVIEALEAFDTPTAVVTRMFRTPAESMYVFTPREIEDLGINRIGANTAQAVELATLRPNTSFRVAAEGLSSAPNPISEDVDKIPTAPPPGPSLGASLRLALYGGLDFYGGDITNARVADAVQCTQMCLELNQCMAFTFNANPRLKSGPNCFLKTGVGRLEAYGDALSGVFLTTPGQSARVFTIGAIDPTEDVLQHRGLSGADFASSPERGILSPGACRMACVDDTSCQAFTYDGRLKQCYLKHNPGRVFELRGLTSGIKRGASFAPLDVIPLGE